MNCDRAFDLITSPADRADSELQRHLQGCPRCRDLAEMLEPALHLLDDSRPSAAYGSENDASCWSSDFQENEYDSKPKGSSRRSRYDTPEYWQAVEAQQRRRGYQEGLKVAAILLLVAVFSAGIAHIGRDTSTPLAQVAAISTESCLRRDTDGRQSAPVLAACVACHLDEQENAKLAEDSHVRVRQLVQRCVTCHLEMKQSPTEVADLRTSSLITSDDEVWGHSAGPCLRLATGG